MKRNYVIFLAIFMILGISTSSNAMRFTSGSFDFGGIGFGKYSVQAYPSNFIFDENGSSGPLDFFKVTLDSLAAGIGKATASIRLSNGSSFNEEGGYWGLHFGRTTLGSISWGNPQRIAYNGGSLELDLFDVKNFRAGAFTIRGTIKNIQNPISVPEPGAMLSLGMVLLGLVAVSRKRFNKRT